jgi:PAS domain S-box-containing protein
MSSRASRESQNEHQALQAELDRTRFFLSEIERISGIGFWERRAGTDEVFCSDRLLRTLGLTPGDIRLSHDLVAEFVHPDDRSIMETVLDYAIRGLQDFNERLRFQLNGDWICLQVSGLRHFDNEGNLVSVRGTAHRVSEPAGGDGGERQRIERELRSSEERYRTLFNASQDLISVNPLDSQGNQLPYIEVNRKACDVIGYSVEELTRLRPADLFDPDFPVDSAADLHRLKESGSLMVERVVVAKDGRRILLEVHASLLTFGGQSMILSVSRDITRRRETERALRESDAKLRNVVEHSSNLFYSHTADHEITYMSPQSRQFFDCEPEEALRRWTEFVTDNPVNEAGFQKTVAAIETGQAQPPYELELVGKKGRKIWVEVHETPVVKDGKTVAIYGALLDITERKKAESKVKRLQEFYQTILENIHDGILVTDENDRLIYVNPGLQRIAGISADKVLGLSLVTDFPPETSEGFLPFYLEARASLRAVEYEADVVTPAGRHTIQTGWFIPRLQSDRCIGMICTMQDITERKNAEEALAESEKRYRGYLDNAPYGVLVANNEGRYIEVNRAACEITGYSQEELLAMSLSDLIHDSDQARAVDYFGEVRARGHARNELRFKPKQGSERYWSVNSVKLSEDEWLGFVSDVTERKRMESELLKMEKLESLGVLAGGIAHDFNNILAAILGNITLAGSSLEVDDDCRPLLSEAESACMRARDLTGQLLTFSKGGAPVVKPTGVVGLIKDTAGFTLRGSHVKHEFDIANADLAANIDEGQFSQVISNLLVNAVQAMPNGGTVTISVHPAEGDSTGVLKPLSNGYIRVTVRDQGIGIPAENIDRLFDPFYTTKQAGSGLGLSTSYSIVRNHGGHIEVSSEIGKGAEFRVYIPASEPVTDEPGDESPEDVKGGGRILIIDDDPSIRKLVGSILGRFGYDVRVADHSRKGIDTYREAHESGLPFAAVIVDLTLPGDLPGDAIMRAILEIDPNAIGIVSSGYAENPIMANYAEHGFAACIAKPYRSGDITSLLHRVLAGRATP